MIEFNEGSMELLPDDENYDENYENYDNCNNKNNTGCKLCLNPIFFEPNKFITADFQIEVRDLCPGSRFALVAEVRRYIHGGRYQTLATVHDIFDVPNCDHKHNDKPCKCKNITRVFKDIILDLNPTDKKHDDPCNNLNADDLHVVVVKANYISINHSSCHFYD